MRYVRLHISNTQCRETLTCRKLAAYHPIGSVGVLVGAWVPKKSCHASYSGFHVTTRVTQPLVCATLSANELANSFLSMPRWVLRWGADVKPWPPGSSCDSRCRASFRLEFGSTQPLTAASACVGNRVWIAAGRLRPMCASRTIWSALRRRQKTSCEV